MEILNFIENKNLNLNKTEYYAAIFGLTPSKGARSPKLWNAAFDGLNFPGFMYPMDVLPENLEALMNNLRSDKRFIGGSVAVPYKTHIIKFLDDIDEEAKNIEAVNCIYRNKDGKLIGSNTDGAGALWSLENVYGNINGSKVLILGAGGAAAAVASYIAKAIGKKGNLLISNRNKKKTDKFIPKLSNKCKLKILDWPVSYEQSKNLDIIINCTSVGFENPFKDKKGYYSLKYFSPLGKINDNIRITKLDNFDQHYVLKAAKDISKNLYETQLFLSQHKNLLIFDIVYQPQTTCLLFLSNLIGHNSLSGNGMNLEQAVIAFDKTTSATGKRNLNQNEVRKYMIEAI